MPSEHILNISYAVIVVLLAIPTSSVTWAAYRATIAGRGFPYMFDKRRLPRCFGVLAAELSIAFIYSFAVISLTGNDIASSLGGAMAFGLLVLFPAALSCVLSVCYVFHDQQK